MLSAGFNLGGDKAHLIDTRGVRDVNDLCHVVEGQLAVRLHEHHLFRTGLEDVVQAALKVLPGHVVLVDLERRLIARSAKDLHDDGAVVILLLLLLILGRLRNQRVQPLRRKRRDHHEDDQQHQQHVNHWGYVNVGGITTAAPPDCHSHNSTPHWVPAPEVAPPVGGLLSEGPACFCSVSKPTSSTPAARTLSTTSTT